MPARAPSVEEQFRTRITVDENGCWLWPTRLDRDGYGSIRVDGRHRSAHRVSYETFIGPIPDGLVIDHLCRRRNCVNPSHLEAVSQRENVLRGSSLFAQRAKATHCKRGHPFDEANTYRWGSFRACRMCRDAHAQRYRLRVSGKASEVGHDAR